MKKFIAFFVFIYIFGATSVSAAAWKPVEPAGYSVITWAKAPGVVSYFKAPSGNGSLDFITRINLAQNQIQFIVAPSTTPQSWGVAKHESFISAAQAAEDERAAFHNYAFERIAAEAAKQVNKQVKFVWNGPFFNVTALTSDLSMAIKTSVGTSTMVSSGSRPENDMGKPRKMLLINNILGTATISDFDLSTFVDSKKGDVGLESFAPTVGMSDNPNGVSARLFLGVTDDKKELVVYCSQGATVAEASRELELAGVEPENQLQADGGGSATCGYNLPGQYFVEPTRTLPMLMGAISFIGRGNPTTDGLNVRTGPATKYAAVKKLNKKDVVTIYEEKAGWYRIGEGMWVSKSLIKKL